MEELYSDSGYFRISYDAEHKMLIVRGYKKMMTLDESAYFKELEKYGEAIDHYKPKYILFDTTEAYYPLSKELDQLIETKITPKLIAAGVEKLALIVPKDVVSQISVEHLITNLQIDYSQITRKFFEDVEEAKHWLLNG